MPMAIGGYYTSCDPGAIDNFYLDFANQLGMVQGDAIGPSPGPTATLVADPRPSADPDSQNWIIGSPLITGSVVGWKIGVVAPDGFKANVTYRFEIGLWTTSGRWLTNYAFIPCVAIP